MGGRYCAINSPRGSRWGAKMCVKFLPPPRTEWWVNCAIPTAHVVLLLSHTLYLGNYLFFFKPGNSWKQQKNTLISEIDSVHSTKRVIMVTPQHLLVTSEWCPSSRARQTLRIFHVGKLHPNHSCIFIQESFWITIHLYLVKQFKI